MTHELADLASCPPGDCEPEVLVVGAGPSGLVLALSLLRNGIPVRIIDKATEVRNGQRGAGIMPRSLELFKFLGISEKILKKSILTPKVRMYELYGGLKDPKSFYMNPISEPSSDVPYPNILCLGQNKLEEILRDELARDYDVHVELGTELIHFSQDIEGIPSSSQRVISTRIRKQTTSGLEGGSSGVVEEERKYSWMLGADGAKGHVRKALGLTFLGETSNVEGFVLGDVVVSGLDDRYWHMWGDPSSTLLSLRGTETPHMFNFMLSGEGVNREHLLSDEVALRTKFFEITQARELNFGEVVWLSSYRPNIRMVNKMSDGRVFLVGDAAHVHSFTGAQGMNTGIQDSFNLAWKLALVHRGLSPSSLLTTYDEERLPVIAEMLNQTMQLLKQNFHLKVNPSESLKGTDSLFQLGVNCRWSSICVGVNSDSENIVRGSENSPLDSCGVKGNTLSAGDRAPDASCLQMLHSELPAQCSIDGSNLTVFDFFGPSHHTVLIFSDDSEQCRRIRDVRKRYCQGDIRTVAISRRDGGALSADYVLRDTKGHAYRSYSFSNACDVVVVRPDAFIGATVKDVEGLERYFTKIFRDSNT